VVEHFGRLDTLVNNAGVGVMQRGDLLEVTPESYDRCQAVNTRAVFFLCQVMARHLLQQGEQDGWHRSIINITSSNAVAVSIARGSTVSRRPARGMVTRLFALRLAEAGVGVYEVRPGVIETAMTRPAKEKYDRMIAEEGLVPVGRWGQPADVAATVVAMAEGRLPYTVWSGGAGRWWNDHGQIPEERQMSEPGVNRWCWSIVGRGRRSSSIVRRRGIR
jgi:NAD(P)-dependent dehydrogenase (short-subunit alcohol dehydrogenase family)